MRCISDDVEVDLVGADRQTVAEHRPPGGVRPRAARRTRPSASPAMSPALLGAWCRA
ncbi:hypothetical protein ACFVZA_01940 [Streptomyces bottropensis]|uniref:hypothetical protein n=1 Tax=Streptomyces bottropensis TaxID=42235 RepID=UPI00369B6619